MVIVVWYNEKKKAISNYKSGKKEQVLVKTMVQVNKILFVMKNIICNENSANDDGSYDTNK